MTSEEASEKVVRHPHRRQAQLREEEIRSLREQRLKEERRQK